MKVVLHGSLKQYPEMEIGGNTVAEVIEGWSRQAGLDLQHPIMIDVLDFDTVDKLTAKTEVIEIHLVPRMYGGKGAFGQILIGAALIGLSFIPGIGQAVQVALLSAGIGMSIGGVMQFFMKTPTIDKSNDPDPSKYISSRGNTTKIGTLIPKGYGRFKYGGQYLSVQVNAQDMVFGKFPATL